MVVSEGMPSPQDEPVEKTQTKQKPSTLRALWLLSNAKNSDNCVDACSKLLKYASANSTELSYILKRLLGGLSSPIEHSRQSYLVCLVEFLRQQDLAYSTVRDEIKQTLKVSGSKSEESVYLLGQILADIALLRAGVAKTKKARTEVLHNLIGNGCKRIYLRLLALNAIIEFYLGVDSEIPTEQLVTIVGQSFKLSLPEAELDSLLFILSFLNIRPDMATADFLSQHFGFKDIKKKSNLERIHKIIFETTLPLNVVVHHPVMSAIATVTTTNKSAKKLVSAILPDMKTSLYKGQIGLTLLREILKCDPSCVEDIIQPEVLQTLLGLCEKNVVDPVVDVVQIIETQIKSGSVCCWTMITRIFECNVSWDKFVPGNLVSSLLSTCDADTLIKAGDLLETKFLSDINMSERVYSAGLLARLLGDPRVITNLDWRIGRLRRLFHKTMITTSDDPSPPLTREAKYQLKEVFYRGLDSACKTLKDNVNFVYSLMNHAMSLMDNKNSVLLKPLKGDTLNAWKKVVCTVKKLGNSWPSNDKKETGLFLLLFSHLGLQFFCQPEMAVDVLTDLQPVYSNWNKAKTSKGDPEGIEVIVEILLSLLAQNKHLLRKVVNCIFKIISNQLTEPALMSMLAAIRSDENSTSNEESSDSEDDDSDVSDNEIDDKDGTEEDALSNEETEDETEDDTEDETEDVEADNVQADVVDKVKEALGKHAQASEDENDDIDMDDIPDEDMKKLDETLVNAFRALGGNKSRSEKKKEKMDHMATQHFKLRVLDLIDIYLHHKPNSKHVFLIISALIESFKILINSPKEEVLYSRIKVVLRKCSCFKLDSTVNPEDVRMLEYLFQLGTSPSPAITSLGNVHARLCVTALRVNLPNNVDQVEKLYIDALKQFFTHSQCMLSYEVFETAVRHSWIGAISIAKEAAERCFDPEVRHFRKSQGLTILCALMKNNQLDELYSEQKKQICLSTLEKIVAHLQCDLGKAKPKQLEAIFQILKLMKQQKLITDDQTEFVKVQLEDFAKNPVSSKLPVAVRKSLKKLLSFYNLNNVFTKSVVGQKVVAVAVNDQSDKNESNQLQATTTQQQKKKKKKSKQAEQKRKENKLKSVDAEDPSSVPSFASFVVDTTKIFVTKEKNIKRKSDHVHSATKNQSKKSKKQS